MHITINGEPRTCTDGLSLRELLLELELVPEKLIAERNRELVPADLFAETLLQEGDTLELLQFVGGG